MCMQSSHVHLYEKWNWAGDEIVPDSNIPASSTPPGSKRKRIHNRYPRVSYHRGQGRCSEKSG